jgi:ADP-ribosyl-[dinitrogen reductase] hydrolase
MILSCRIAGPLPSWRNYTLIALTESGDNLNTHHEDEIKFDKTKEAFAPIGQGRTNHLDEDDYQARADRAEGALLGLATGDALGTTLEFAPRDSRPPIDDLIGGGPFNLKPGQWTDDTAMALALGESLLHNSDLDERDLMSRFVAWFARGEYSCTGSCFDIGSTTRTALESWKRTGDPIAGSVAPDTAGNGSLMRLAPVAIRHWSKPEKLQDIAGRQSRTTHGAEEAVDACCAYAELLAEAIGGSSREQILRPRSKPYVDRVQNILGGSWRSLSRHEVRSSGYVIHSLEAALWAVGSTDNFASAVIAAANLGDDADTTAAITGQLAGALYGASSIPSSWLVKLAWAEQIKALASKLYDESID